MPVGLSLVGLGEIVQQRIGTWRVTHSFVTDDAGCGNEQRARNTSASEHRTIRTV